MIFTSKRTNHDWWSALIVLFALFSWNPAHAQGTPNCSSSSSDPDGDGYGWENNATCIVATTSTSPECVDPDGDGYGWDGTQTCLVSNSEGTDSDNSPSDILDDAQRHEQAALTGIFQNLGDFPGRCKNLDSNGFGWTGSKSCINNDHLSSNHAVNSIKNWCRSLLKGKESNTGFQVEYDPAFSCYERTQYWSDYISPCFPPRNPTGDIVELAVGSTEPDGTGAACSHSGITPLEFNEVYGSIRINWFHFGTTYGRPEYALPNVGKLKNFNVYRNGRYIGSTDNLYFFDYGAEINSTHIYTIEHIYADRRTSGYVYKNYHPVQSRKDLREAILVRQTEIGQVHPAPDELGYWPMSIDELEELYPPPLDPGVVNGWKEPDHAFDLVEYESGKILDSDDLVLDIFMGPNRTTPPAAKLPQPLSERVNSPLRYTLFGWLINFTKSDQFDKVFASEFEATGYFIAALNRYYEVHGVDLEFPNPMLEPGFSFAYNPQHTMAHDFALRLDSAFKRVDWEAVPDTKDSHLYTLMQHARFIAKLPEFQALKTSNNEFLSDVVESDAFNEAFPESPSSSGDGDNSGSNDNDEHDSGFDSDCNKIGGLDDELDDLTDEEIEELFSDGMGPITITDDDDYRPGWCQ